MTVSASPPTEVADGPSDGTGGFERTGDRLVHRGAVVSFHERTFRAPGGETMVRDVVTHPGAVSVVAVDDDGLIVLVRQYRAAIEAEMWEIPAGKLDIEGEDLFIAARRELAEEVGLAAASLVHLISFHNSPGFCDEFQHTYLATGLTDVGEDRQGVEEEYMTIRRWSFDEARVAILDGTITDAKTIIGITLAASQLAGASGAGPHDPS